MKIGIVSLGCDKNRVDSEKLIARLVAAGHEIVSSEEEADVIVVNTCAFTEDAKTEAIDEILSAAEAKKRDARKKLVVTAVCPKGIWKASRRNSPRWTPFSAWRITTRCRARSPSSRRGTGYSAAEAGTPTTAKECSPRPTITPI